MPEADLSIVKTDSKDPVEFFEPFTLLSGGPSGPSRVANSTVFFGAVEAQGCFRKVEAGNEIPAAERGAASEFISTG